MKTATGSFSLKIIGAALGLLGGVLFARILGPKEFGIYTLAMSVITLAGSVVTFGQPTLLAREVAGYGARREWGLLRGIIYAGHQWSILVFVALLCLSGVVVFSKNLFPALPAPFFVVGAFLALVMALNLIRAGVLRGLHRVILADIPDVFLRPTLALLLLVVAYVWLRRLDARIALYLQAIAAVGAFLLGSWYLRRHIPPQAFAAPIERDAKSWLTDAHTLFWLTNVTLLEGQVVIYVLGYLSGAHAVGLFQAARQFVVSVTMGLLAVNAPLQPKLRAAWALGDKTGAQSLLTEAARLAAIIGIMSAVVLLPFAVVITFVYGNQYEAAVNALRILVVGQLVNAVAGPCRLVLISTGHQRVVLFTAIVALAINLILSVTLIPIYGTDGAAAAVVASLITWNVVTAIAAARLTGLKSSILQAHSTKDT